MNNNNNYQQTGYPNQTFYPNQPPIGGGMPPKKKNNALMITLISVAVVLVLIIAIVIAFSMGKKTNVGFNPYMQQNNMQTNATTANQDEKQEKSSADAEAGAKKTETTKASGKFSRQNPAPLGTEQVFDYENEYDETDNYSVSIKIIEAIRGESAFTKLKEKSSFVDAAPEGYEYVLAKIAMTVLSVGGDKAVEANQYSFVSFTSNNEENEDVFESCPDPEFDGMLYEGGSVEGWAVFLVKVGDTNPKLAYELNYDGTGGAWFALQ